MSSKQVRQQFADTMLDVGQSDQKLVVMVGDISHGILQPFAKACPGRYYNAGILEPTMMSMGAGLARTGLFPVIHTIAPFLIERAFEQIKLDFCYHGLHGNIVTVGSAFDYAYLGCTHHCYGDFALLKTLENVQITYPSTPIEFDSLFKQTYDNDMVTVFRVPGNQHSISFKTGDIIFGKGIKISDGKDVTLVATGPQLNSALGAKEILSSKGWDVEIIYIHTVRPLDTDLIIASVEKTRHVIVIEEHMTSGGLGDDVLRAIRNIPSTKYASASIPDKFLRTYGSYEDHCESVGLTADGISNLVLTEFGT
ncbi:MAG: transketolase C-terminal domain-containing protein [Rhodospirillaceae bacterium]